MRSEIKLGNGDCVVETLKSRKALGMVQREAIPKMVEDDIVLNNGDDVLEQIENEDLSSMSTTHDVLVEPSYCGEVDMEAVRESAKNNAKFIVNHWHEDNEQ